jgi:hypothetical protein
MAWVTDTTNRHSAHLHLVEILEAEFARDDGVPALLQHLHRLPTQIKTVYMSAFSNKNSIHDTVL